MAARRRQQWLINDFLNDFWFSLSLHIITNSSTLFSSDENSSREYAYWCINKRNHTAWSNSGVELTNWSIALPRKLSLLSEVEVLHCSILLIIVTNASPSLIHFESMNHACSNEIPEIWCETDGVQTLNNINIPYKYLIMNW